MCENFLGFRPFGPELRGKRGVFRLSHFFCVKVNVIIPYMGTFFEAMILKLCTGYLVHITEYENVISDFARLGQNYGEKGFLKCWT